MGKFAYVNRDNHCILTGFFSENLQAVHLIKYEENQQSCLVSFHEIILFFTIPRHMF